MPTACNNSCSRVEDDDASNNKVPLLLDHHHRHGGGGGISSSKKAKAAEEEDDDDACMPLGRRAWEENKMLWVVAAPSIVFTRFSSFGVTVISPGLNILVEHRFP
jgi:MATE family multidrug resistance protein